MASTTGVPACALAVTCTSIPSASVTPGHLAATSSAEASTGTLRTTKLALSTKSVTGPESRIVACAVSAAVLRTLTLCAVSVPPVPAVAAMSTYCPARSAVPAGRTLALATSTVVPSTTKLPAVAS